MLTFKSFDIETEEQKICDFLKENNDRLLSKGGVYHEGRLCFLYSADPAPEVSEAEQDKFAAIEYINKKIEEYKSMILDSDSILIYWKDMATKTGDKKIFKSQKGYMSAKEMRDEVLEQRDNQAIQLAGFLKLRESISNSKYSFDRIPNDNVVAA